MVRERIYELLKLAFTFASEEDYGNRELGVIHLLKLLYLADLAHAERNQGKTYTGIPWQFYNFGPWNAEAHREIEVFLDQLKPESKIVSSRFDTRRFSLQSGRQLYRDWNDIGREVPHEVCSAIKQSVHEYGADTALLLRHVYSTLPMLHAKPGQMLDFSFAAVSISTTGLMSAAAEAVALSKSKEKKKEQRRKEIKQEIQAKIQARIQKRQSQQVTSPVDQDFLAIMNLLDQDDNATPITGEGQLEFDQSIWDGCFRRECGLS